jgi:hypothetical protein
MVAIFFDMKGIVDKEFVLAGQIVSSTYYCDVLWRVRETLRRLRPKLWLLHLDNAPSHTSFSPGNFLPNTI